MYEWANGVRVYSLTRQMADCAMETEDIVLGTKGQARVIKHEITSGEEKWRYRGEKPSMYDVEHVELFASLKAGKPINNGTYMSYSTLLAIMGRMATYTGQKITWQMAMNSKEDLSPKSYDWGPLKYAPPAVPGITKFA